MTYVSVELRRAVIERAGNCCEYCLRSQEDTLFSFHIEHIISEKHDGKTILINLGLSCPDCNRYKGSDIGSIDWETDDFIGFYNPRTQRWNEHFKLEGSLIDPITPEGRVTAKILRMNSPEQIIRRNALIALGRYPCQPPR